MWKKVRRPQEEKSRYIKRLKKCWIYKENQDMKKLVSTDFSAENWLILGKKWSMMIATADKYGCRTLPMRNWHNIVYYFHYVTCVRIKVGHYLWGIDTITNTPTLSSSQLDGHWSDITYEELTLSHVLSFIKFLILSDITYEELTLLSKLRINFYLNFSDCRTLPMRNWHLRCLAPRIKVIIIRF